MKLSGKNILIISPDGWGNYFLSKHHYALELSKKNRVYFLNFANRSKSFKIEEIQENLFSVDYKSSFPKIHMLPDFLKKRIFARQANYISKKINKDFDIVWSFDAFRFSDLNAFKSKLKIFHSVDRYKNGMENLIAKSSDIIFTSAEEISTMFKTSSKPVYQINHGVASSFFKENLEHVNLPGNNKIKALYSGNVIHKHINFKLFQNLISKNPEIDFVFLGAYAANHSFISFIESSNNAFLLGKMHFENLINYYNSADILLICYDDKIKESPPLPHKLYEYLASGKVVLCNNLEKVNVPNPILFKAKNEKDYLSLFKSIVQNLEQLNADENQNLRFNLAKENSYTAQLKKIESHITQLHSP